MLQSDVASMRVVLCVSTALHRLKVWLSYILHNVCMQINAAVWLDDDTIATAADDHFIRLYTATGDIVCAQNTGKLNL